MKNSIVTTNNFPDMKAMTKVVAQTCTAEFHRRKGYVDIMEESAITFNELLKLFDIKLHNNTTKVSDIIIELEDCFIYAYTGDISEKIVINPDEFKAPSHDRLIIYVLNQEVIDWLNREKEYHELCETIFDRLTAKNTNKPILVFHWVDSIKRGEHAFSASSILKNLNETGFEKILQFQGVYTYSHKKKSCEIVLRQRSGSNGKRYNVVRLKTCHDFIDYWDKQIKEWGENNGKITPDEDYWNSIKVGKRSAKSLSECIGLNPKLIPEPYFGDPEHCLLVIVNFNPGMGGFDEKNSRANTQHIDNKDNTDTACGCIVSEGYSSIAKSFPMLDDEDRNHPHKRSDETKKEAKKNKKPVPLLYPGYKWWHPKKAWFDTIKDKLGLEHNKPFALELCGWHSKSWKNIDYSDEILLDEISGRLKDVIIQAVAASDLKIGICVGSPFKKILEHMGYEQIPLNKPIEFVDWIVGTNGVETFPNYFFCEDKKSGTVTVRGYRLFRHKKEGTLIINTWLIGSNQYPSDGFKDFEIELFKSIRANRAKI